MAPQLGIRWTIGAVNPAGFEALRLSIHGALHLFGADAEYRVYVNTISVRDARSRTGQIPPAVQWVQAEHCIPTILRPYLGNDMAEGVAWKLMPVRAFPDSHELSLDNDVILWRIPPAIEQWVASKDSAATLVAADISAAFGKFADLCGPQPLNSGIRGLGPALDFEAALAHVLRIRPTSLETELDEQGLQIAAVGCCGTPFVVDAADVTICSPFYPHNPELGRAGAHFVGLNTRVLPWLYYGKPAAEVRLAHWMSLREALYGRIGLAVPPDGPPRTELW